jgi:hypothetical protein
MPAAISVQYIEKRLVDIKTNPPRETNVAYNTAGLHWARTGVE